MFNLLILAFTATSLFATTVDSKPWRKVTHPVKAFANQQVTALASHGDNLLVGAFLTKKKSSVVEIYNVKTKALKDISARVHVNPQDSVTRIWISPDGNLISVGTNNNRGADHCFDANLAKAKCDPKLFSEQDDLFQTKMASGNPIETATSDEAGAVLGEFKGPVYFKSQGQPPEQVYSPKNPFQWPVSCALSKDLALVGTKGDGFIVINRQSKNVTRFPDKDAIDVVTAVVVSGKNVYLGSDGLYEAALADLK
jgi:hypothetical protein